MSSRIAFFHANGYPPGVYNVFLSALTRLLNGRGQIVASPLLATPDTLKATMRWPHMLGVAQQHAAQSNANLLLGHSMGGYLALQTAAANPSRYRRVILIDSPIPAHWRAGLLTISQLTGLVYKFGPASVARGRRDRWLSRENARSHFAKKAFVKRWASGVLNDFVAHALVDDADGVTLTIPRASERDSYAHLVHSDAIAALRQARAAGVSIDFIAGGHSEELGLADRDANQALFAPHHVELEGVGHLIPMETPERCAALVAATVTDAT